MACFRISLVRALASRWGDSLGDRHERRRRRVLCLGESITSTKTTMTLLLRLSEFLQFTPEVGRFLCAARLFQGCNCLLESIYQFRIPMVSAHQLLRYLGI